MKLLGKTLEQWAFSNKDQLDLLDSWYQADKYTLTNREFCESLIANGSTYQKRIGQAGLDAPGQGKRFIDVLEGWFPSIIINTIRAAETAGIRSEGIEAAIEQLKGGENITLKLAQMLAFPYFLALVFGTFGVYIADKLLATVEYAPGLGLDIRNAVATYGPIAAILCLLLLVALAIALPNWKGSSRNSVNSAPLFKLHRVAVTATLFKTLSSLTKCGIKLNDALELVHEKNTPFLKWHIETMQSQSIGQSNLGRILDTGLVLPSELNALKVLGERVDYYELLTKSSEHHSDYVTAQLKKMKEWLPKAGLIITIVLLGSLISSSAYQIYLDLL